MTPFLKSIVINGYDGKQRTLEFQSGVNIITGVGSKGKSAIVRIVEYCFGAPYCRIPVGKVRDFAAWYFLILNVRGRRMILGRRAPQEPAKSSDEAFFDDSRNATIPSLVKANTLIGYACKKLGEHMGVPSEAFRLDTNALVFGNVEVRDLLPLMLQPQDIIASQNLFIPIPRDGKIEANHWTEVVKIALRIISPELLAVRAERNRLIKAKESLNRRRRDSDKLRAEPLRRIHALWEGARNAGLVPEARIESVNDAKAILEKLDNGSLTEPQVATTNNQLAAELEAQSQASRRRIKRINDELKQIAKIRNTSHDVHQSLAMQSGRLRVVDLLGAPMQEETPCPLCGSKLAPNANILNDLQATLDEDLIYVRTIPPELDTAEEKLQRELNEENNRMGKIENQLKDLQKQEIAPTLTAERIHRERLIGALGQELRWAPISPTVDFTAELQKAQAHLETVDERIRLSTPEEHEGDVRKSLRDLLTALASHFPRLDLRSGALVFDNAFSTIERIVGSTRAPLAVLGAAENFVMYHLCALLGLHVQLISNKSFVPPLLILDQPSQTHFPTESDPNRTDLNAVKAIYDLLFKVVEDLATSGASLQIIVLDHADFSRDDERFRNAVKYDWHGDEGLVENE